MQKNNKSIYLILHWLFKLINGIPSKQFIRAVSSSWVFLSKLRRTRGLAGIKRYKSISDDLVKWVVLRSSKDFQYIRKDDKGKFRTPRGFHWVHNKVLNKTLAGKVLILTCLYYHRTIKCTPNRDISTITNCSRWRPLRWIALLTEAILLGFKWHLNDLGSPLGVFKWDVSWKTGPNGKPAWSKALIDLKSVILSDFRFPLLYLFLRVLPQEKMRRDRFLNVLYFSLEKFGKPWQVFFRIIDWSNTEPTTSSKLAFLSDKSGKTRVIAMADIWSQSVLKVYHDRMLSILRALSKVDGTYDQDKQRKRIQEWSAKKLWMSSVDMSAATDRLPAKVIALALYLTKTMSALEAICWYVIMTWRSFSYTDKDSRIKYTSYSVGQPMGLYSSWSAFSLTHHMIVQLSAFLSGYRLLRYDNLYFDRYAILGDDIVIADKSVASWYKRILSILDVQISVAKSWEGVGTAEFAKSLFVEGLNYSSLPWGLLKGPKYHKTSDCVLLLWSLTNRGWKYTLKEYLSTIPSYCDREKVYVGITCPLYPVYYPSHLWDEYTRGYIEILTLKERFQFPLKKESGTWVNSILKEDPYPLKWSVGQYTPSGVTMKNFSVPDVFGLEIGPGFITWDPETPSVEMLKMVVPISKSSLELDSATSMKHQKPDTSLAKVFQVANLTDRFEYSYLDYDQYKDCYPFSN